MSQKTLHGEKKDFFVDFFMNDNLEAIQKKLRGVKNPNPNSLKGKPFNGVYCIYVDGVDIVRVANLEDPNAVLRVNYPLDKVSWLNDNLRQIIIPEQVKPEERVWRERHEFSYPGGDYSPAIQMYAEGNWIVVKWDLGPSFEYERGEIIVTPKVFGSGVLKAARKANGLYSFLSELHKYEPWASFEGKLAENEGLVARL